MTDYGRAVPDGLSSSTEPVSRLGPSGFDPSRVRLAFQRVGQTLNQVDYDCGHFITADNLKISDVQILFDYAQAQDKEVEALIHDLNRAMDNHNATLNAGAARRK